MKLLVSEELSSVETGIVFLTLWIFYMVSEELSSVETDLDTSILMIFLS